LDRSAGVAPKKKGRGKKGLDGQKGNSTNLGGGQQTPIRKREKSRKKKKEKKIWIGCHRGKGGLGKHIWGGEKSVGRGYSHLVKKGGGKFKRGG